MHIRRGLPADLMLGTKYEPKNKGFADILICSIAFKTSLKDSVFLRGTNGQYCGSRVYRDLWFGKT